MPEPVLDREDATCGSEHLRNGTHVRHGATGRLLGEPNDRARRDDQCERLPVPLPAPPHDPDTGAEGTNNGEGEEGQVVDGLDHVNSRGGG